MSDKESGALPEGVEWPSVDGEPVVPGDVLWDRCGRRHEVSEVSFTTGCMSGSVDMADGGVWVSMDDLTRTEPEPVLDRDGVPIEVGDTVYALTGDAEGSRLTVERVGRGTFCVRARSASGYVYQFRGEDLAHEPPDSWERLEEDARKDEREYWGCEHTMCRDCPARVDGKKPYERYGSPGCGDAVRLDIVRRAKALAGVVGDE